MIEQKAGALWNAYRLRFGITEFTGLQYDLNALIQPVNLDAEGLDEPFSDGEIACVLKNLPAGHAQGPDGFNGIFVKKCWSNIKDDFGRLIKYFKEGFWI